MIDQEKIDKFLAVMRDAVGELEKLDLPSVSFEGYQGDRTLQALSEHYLRLAIEAALDLGRHVILGRRLEELKGYRDVGEILCGKGIIPAELSERLAAWAEMRNTLIYLYWDVDYQRLYEIVTEELSDFDEYAQCILHFVAEEGEEG